MKPVAEACLRNQQPIADALAPYLQVAGRWLELGSGTGQHGVYIAGRYPSVRWQLSDVADTLAGMSAWQREAGLPNLPEPIVLDAADAVAPGADYDGVFTANTLHFVGWPVAEAILDYASGSLKSGGTLAVYGPFNDNGRFTSEGNARLDAWLKSRDATSGIKDEQTIVARAAALDLILETATDMPANNRFIVFQKH
ncbi:DUF938 domain-containing protein [Marinobacter sp. 1Y8]